MNAPWPCDRRLSHEIMEYNCVWSSQVRLFGKPLVNDRVDPTQIQIQIQIHAVPAVHSEGARVREREREIGREAVSYTWLYTLQSYLYTYTCL